MKIDLSLVIAVLALAVTMFGLLAIYLSTARLRDTTYDFENRRVNIDKTRSALEVDIRRMYEEIYRDRGRWEELNHLAVDSASNISFHTKKEQFRSAIDPSRFLKSFGLSAGHVEVVPDQVFFLTPLATEEAATHTAVHVACRRAGLKAVRGDEQNISGAILPAIVSEIVRSRFIIANLNGRNPNVFYEMGIAQALGKDVLMFSHRNDAKPVPFDVAHQRIIFYDKNGDLADSLTDAIAQLGWENNKISPDV